METNVQERKKIKIPEKDLESYVYKHWADKRRKKDAALALLSVSNEITNKPVEK